METAVLEKKFETIGARAKISNFRRAFMSDVTRAIFIDIKRDEDGEFFDILTNPSREISVLDVQKKDRHLLLMTRSELGKPLRYLCGHDERHWFTCAVPGGVSTVSQAKQALKPPEVVQAEVLGGVKAKNLHKHKRKMASGGKIIRQGEFMFIPDPNLVVKETGLSTVLRNEPMRRGRMGNAHYAEYLFRRGGITVHVCGKFPNGLTEGEYIKHIKKNPADRTINWQIMKRDPEAFVKGRITHKEHATVDFKNIWHRVILNTENLAPGARFVSFLD